MTDRAEFSLITRSADQTRAFGAAMGEAIRDAKFERAIVIALNGELGAGKTTLVNGFMRALGVSGAVRSPTYTLIEPYEFEGETAGEFVGRVVFHLDLYRLADPSELEMLAPRDLLEPRAVLLVEWAERAGAALPHADLTLELAYLKNQTELETNTQRVIQVRPGSSAGEALAASLQHLYDEGQLSA